MAKQKNSNIEPDIFEIRKKQAEQALEIAKTIDSQAYAGKLNDRSFYLVTKSKDTAGNIQKTLSENNIQTAIEHRRHIPGDYALHLLDEPKESEESDIEPSIE